MEPSNLLAEVNASIRELAARSDRDQLLEWEFLCECGDLDCVAHIALPLASYDAVRNESRFLLAPGHLPGRPRKARDYSAPRA